MSELDGSEYREASVEAPAEAGAESHRESAAEAGESGPAEAGEARDGPDMPTAGQEEAGHEPGTGEPTEPGTGEPTEPGPAEDRLQGEDAVGHSAGNAGSSAREQAGPAGPEADQAKLASPDAEPEPKALAGDPGESGPAEPAPREAEPAEAEPGDAPPAEPAPRKAEPAESGPAEPGFDEPAGAGAGHPGELQPAREADGERSDHRAGTSDTRNGDLVPGEGEPVKGGEDVPKDMAGRPDVSKAYPDVFTEQDSSGLAVDRPHQSPETWINDVNPGNGSNNCGECARAVQATWSGDPSVAATLTDRTARGEPNACMPQWAGQESQPASMQQVGDRLEALGPGSSAVVGFDRHNQDGHWFNAINDGGVIKAVDGQSGMVEPWPPSVAGLGFDESEMAVSDALFFDPDGVMIR